MTTITSQKGSGDMQEWRVVANIYRDNKRVMLPTFYVQASDSADAINTVKAILNPDEIISFYVRSILRGLSKEYVNWPVYIDYINGDGENV